MSAVSEEHILVIQKLQSLSTLSMAYLAGGTNLALRFNHRRSIDIDLFVQDIIGKVGYLAIQSQLVKNFGKNLVSCQFPCDIDDQYVFLRAYVIQHGTTIKIEVLQNMKNVDEIETFDGIRMASLKDIGLFKLISLSRRKNFKDLYDLDFITDTVSLDTLLEHLSSKLKTYSKEQFRSIFDLGSSDNPVENPLLLLAFETTGNKDYVPFHSIDKLDILKGNKNWLVARSNWRRKVRQLFTSRGISFPEVPGVDID